MISRRGTQIESICPTPFNEMGIQVYDGKAPGCTEDTVDDRGSTGFIR
jgi:hypothetical protein